MYKEGNDLDITDNTLRDNGITILICTHNGADKLKDTLSALTKQITNPSLFWEIIVVNNLSSDDSGTIAQQIWDQFEEKPDISFKVFHEDTIGKYFALEKGLKNASFEYFIIVDDDNHLYPNYVQLAFDLINNDPSIGAIGSNSIPKFQNAQTKLPTWFTNHKERYAIGEQGTSGDVTHRRHLWGAGMISRTSLYLEFYSKYPSFLIGGTKEDILIAEDTEYCLRLLLRGYKLFYNSELKLDHYVPESRLSIEYSQKLNSRINDSFRVIDAYYMAVKFFDKKYRSQFEKIRLQILTPIRYYLSFNNIKRNRQKTLMGFIFPNSRFNTSLTNQVKAFVKDDTIPRVL